MGTRGYVGRPDATDPTLLHLRYVHSDAVPEYMAPTLVAIQQVTFAGDTTATVTALLSCVWAYLGADVTASNAFPAGDTPVPGVGMAIHAAPADPPITVPTHRIGELSGQWIYLLDPQTNTLTVLSTDDPANPAATYTFTEPSTTAATGGQQ
ncbi:hypothetical protein [Dactylosporangium sp. NPDC048998]|uniref:hypothetical protein n=1 Tax=Dactylosporangium sp. NPDC048998 TaxID=3363976 RepID=UPI00372206AE